MSSTEPSKEAPNPGSDNDQHTKDVAPTTEQALDVSEAAPRKNLSWFTRAFRSPLFNVILVGLISFTQPGIWNALNSQFPCPPLSSNLC